MENILAKSDCLLFLFPKGFVVYFFNKTGDTVSEITADYGINYEKKKILEAQKNVVIFNYETQEQLNTEKIIWDKRKKEIFAPVPVKITTPDKVVFGDSIWADESFNRRKIYGVRATLEIEDDNY